MSDIPFLHALGDLLESAIAREPQPSRPRLSSLRGRRLAVAATVGLLLFGGVATAGVIGVEALLRTAPAGTLFRADPAFWNQINHDRPPADGVIQSSVREIEKLTIPRVGRIEYWVARTRSGGSCEAFRFPDGRWAGFVSEKTYSFGGDVPGCQTPDRGGNVSEGGGFDFATDSFGPSQRVDPHTASDSTYVLFGTVDVRGAVQVRDPRTGRTARILDGEFFAIKRPERLFALPRRRDRSAPPDTLPRLQALSRSGKVLSTSWTEHRILAASKHGHVPPY
jgi:hypothetical protein